MSVEKQKTKLKIVYVEDNPADILLMEETCLKNGVENFVILKTGAEALNYFFKEAEKTKDSVADLILLDLNLPGLRGMEVLKELKKHPQLRMIPVVIFSSSQRHSDIQECYAAGGNSFIVKPQELNEFEQTIESLIYYWSKVVHLAVPSSAFLHSKGKNTKY